MGFVVVMGIKIRKFDKSDEEDLVKILELNGQYDFPDVEGPMAMTRVSECDAAVFLVATMQERVIGLIKGVYDGSRALIHLLSIDPNYRNLKIGTKLVNAIASEFKRRGARIICVTAAQASLGFWEKLEFEKLPVFLMLKNLDQELNLRF